MKKLSVVEIILYLGCIVTISLIEFITYAWFIILFNILFLIFTSLFIINKSNLKEFQKNYNFDISKVEKMGLLTMFSLFGIGTFVGLYDLYLFYKNPITKKYDTKEQYERDKKLKKLGI